MERTSHWWAFQPGDLVIETNTKRTGEVMAPTELAELRAAAERILDKWEVRNWPSSPVTELVEDATSLARAFLATNQEGDELPVTAAEVAMALRGVAVQVWDLKTGIQAKFGYNFYVVVKTRRQLAQLLAGLGLEAKEMG